MRSVTRSSGRRSGQWFPNSRSRPARRAWPTRRSRTDRLLAPRSGALSRHPLAPPLSYTVDLVPSGTLLQLPEWASCLLETTRVGHLAVVDAVGRPRVLPVTYAVCEGAAWTVIDNKPKRAGREPARIHWLRERPRAAITIDRYSDDWSELQWAQLLG